MELRITAKAADLAKAEELIVPVEGDTAAFGPPGVWYGCTQPGTGGVGRAEIQETYLGHGGKLYWRTYCQAAHRPARRVCRK